MTTDAGTRQLVRRLHASFVVAGMVTTLLGPLLPLLVARWALADAAAGALVLAQFAASAVAGMLSTAIAARVGDRRVIAVGFLVMAIGVATVGAGSYRATVVSVATYGIGLGLALPSTNFLVARLVPERSAAAVSLLNLMWGVGAMTWPVLVAGVSGSWGSTRGLLFALSIALVVVGGAMLRAHTLPFPGPAVRSLAPARTGGIGSAIALFALLIFCYGATEQSIGAWVNEFLRRAAPGATAWQYGATLFWSALTGGRLLAPVTIPRLGEGGVLVTSLLLAGVAVAGLLVPGAGLGWLMLAATLAGFGLGPVFPITVAALARDIGPRAPGLLGPLYALNGIGGALFPWLIGSVSTALRSLRAGLSALVVVWLALLVLHTIRLRREAYVKSAVAPS